MNILILEDDFHHQKRIMQTIESMTDLQIDDIFLSSNPSRIIEHADQKSSGNVYFLDLEIDGQPRAGFQTASKLREKDLFGPIIFITTHSEMAPVTFEYQVSALDFVAKDLTDKQFSQRIRSSLEKALQQIDTLASDYDYFTFQNKYCSFQIPFSEILYFETTEIPHKTRLIAINREMEFYADLKELEPLDDRLYRCHKSYLVNTSRIQSIRKTERIIEFPSGHSCLISRKHLKLLQEKLRWEFDQKAEPTGQVES